MIIIEYDRIQDDADHIMLRYWDDVTPSAQMNQLVIDIKTFTLLLRGWGMVACEYPGTPGTRPNLDNGTINRWAPVSYCGTVLHIACQGKEARSAEVIAYTKLMPS